MSVPSDHHFRTPSAWLGIAAIFLAGPAVGSDNPGAHQHGHAQLQVAIEGQRLELILNSPAHNLAGFEHEARTEEEKSQLAATADWLGTQPLLDTLPASCTVENAVVHHSGTSQDEHGHEHEHEHDNHGHGEGDHDEHQRTHTEYEVTQQLDCPGLGTDSSLNAAFLERFPGVEVLSVQWVSKNGQGSARLEDGSRGFSLGN